MTNPTAPAIEGLEETDDAVIVFVSHQADAFLPTVNRKVYRAWRDATGYHPFPYLNSERNWKTNDSAARYAHTDLGDGRVLTTFVFTWAHWRGEKMLAQLHGISADEAVYKTHRPT